MRARQAAIAALVATSMGLVPWTLWLAYTLPGRHLAHHYDVAWIGFDVALALTIAATAIAALRRSSALRPLAAATATMLLADAWFDVVTSWDLEALLLAVLVELPLAALCLLLLRRRNVFEQP